jgi:hypothetical protein
VALGTSAGDVYLEGHYRNAASFGREMSRQVQTPAMRAGQEASKHFGRKFAAGLAVGAAVIGAGVFKATKLAIRGIAATTKAASDLNETITKSRVIFGPAFAAVDKFARGSAKALGLSRQEALANAASFGDMFKQIGFGIQPAAKMSKGMVTLAADLASFHNADITQVLEAQQAGFRGEYDSLQRFIPAINAARVQQVAMAQTGKKNAQELTAQEKAAATYTIMLRDTKDAQGDFLRTSKENANQQRIAKAQWLDLKAALGQAFLPAQLAVTRAFTEKLLPAGKVFVRELAPGLKSAATAIGTSLAGAVPPAAELAVTARHLGDRLEALGPDLGAKVGAGIGKLFDLLTKLGPELRNANVQTGDLAPTLRLSGALFGFVADHADTLAKHIPLVVAGFVAYKAAQAAANTAALLSIPIRAAEVVATLALARSNRALIASMGERTAATVTLTAAETGLVASTSASAAVGATWLSRLRPLAVALGGYAAGVGLGAVSVAKFNDTVRKGSSENERFGRTVQLGTKFGGLYAQSQDAAGAAQRRTTAATQSATTAADRHAIAVRAERDAISALKGALEEEETAELDVRQAKLNVSNAQRRLTELTKEGRKGSNDYKQAQLDLRRAQIELRGRTTDYKNAQAKANSATGEAMRASQQATPKYRGFGEAARVAGIKARTMGNQAREGIMRIPSKTVLIKATFGFKTPPGVSVHDIVGATGGRVTPRAIVPMRRARGGPVWGAGTTTSDSIDAQLSDQEHVWEAAAVKGAGGGSYQRGHERLAMMRREARGMAAGGPVLDNKVTTARPMLRAASRFEGVIDRGIRRMAARWDKVADQFGGGILGGGSGPGGWQWQMSVLRRVFPGLALISGYRPGAITATGNRSYHASGRAVDVPPRMDVFNWIRGTYGRRTRELIFSPAGGRQVWNGRPHTYSGITRANHWDHVHWAYDKGGWLMPGTTVATNRTGKPERILGPGEPIELATASRRALARDIADALVAAGVGATYLDSRRAEQLLAGAGLSNSRRR